MAMTISQGTFRKNFMIVSVMHVIMILGLCLTDGILKSKADHSEAIVQLISPADLLGDLPAGQGNGRGLYSPPVASAEIPSELSSPAPSGARFVPKVESVASPKVVSRPKPVSIPNPTDNVVHIPKTVPANKKVRKPPREFKSNTDETVQKTKKPGQNGSAKKSAPNRVTNSGGSARVDSAASFLNRFNKALQNENYNSSGSAFGDGKSAGGGSGKSKVIGSPNGAANGIVGGQGKGSPFWSYYLHVHDKMYEAWEQPGKVLDRDRGLMSTVKLKVARDGSILKVQLASSSGNGVMDDSALAAARRVHRLNPLPVGLGDEVAEITVNFELES